MGLLDGKATTQVRWEKCVEIGYKSILKLGFNDLQLCP